MGSGLGSIWIAVRAVIPSRASGDRLRASIRSPILVWPMGQTIKYPFSLSPTVPLSKPVSSGFLMGVRMVACTRSLSSAAVLIALATHRIAPRLKIISMRNSQIIIYRFAFQLPLFGAGLIEAIADSAIFANLTANQAAKTQLGIGGHPNRSANTGTITRFGWKAQNQSLLMFAGEAYNVEIGISNELFQNERDDNPTCQYAPVPNDSTVVDGSAGLPASQAVSDLERFAFFMKFLAPPVPSKTTPGGANSIAHGQQKFGDIGCSLCHTPSLKTSGASEFAALANVTVNLFSDLVVHKMGPKLADDIGQGAAAGDEFRTAPLWGLGQRIFFLHDGRTNDLVQAIYAHASGGNARYAPSEANQVIAAFNSLSDKDKQDLLNFLRSL